MFYSDVLKCAGRMREYRKVPIDRLIAKLNLSKYNVDADLKNEKLKTGKVEILMSQHIGAPANIGNSGAIGIVETYSAAIRIVKVPYFNYGRLYTESLGALVREVLSHLPTKWLQ